MGATSYIQQFPEDVPLLVINEVITTPLNGSINGVTLPIPGDRAHLAGRPSSPAKVKLFPSCPVDPFLFMMKSTHEKCWLVNDGVMDPYFMVDFFLKAYNVS